jgi:hypothetical protein
MGNFIAKTSTPTNKDIYITCLDKMEKGFATPVYQTSTCKKCKINIHYNFNNTNLFNKNTCFNCENISEHYIIDVLPTVPISS